MLYDRIKELRIKMGMSQDTLAMKTGYTSRTSISKIENGEVDLNQSKIQIFANALNTSPAYLMGWTDKKEPSDLQLLQDAHLYLSDKEKKYAPLLNVSAGAFHEDISQLKEEIEIPERWEHLHGKIFAIRIIGESMNRVLPNGTTVLCEDISQTGYKAKDGDFVVFEHEGEYTVKKLVDTSSMVILDPCSYDDGFEPIIFTKNPYLELKILGVVRRSFMDY